MGSSPIGESCSSSLIRNTSKESLRELSASSTQMQFRDRIWIGEEEQEEGQEKEHDDEEGEEEKEEEEGEEGERGGGMLR